MKKKSICLFTAHTPTSGGGGAILRSLIANLPNVDITWYYTADQPAPGYEASYLGKSIMGGPFLHDIKQTWKLLNGGHVKPLDELVQLLLNIPCDEYWMVSHNEGLRLAYELALVQKSRPVHITVHDDWAGALSARSVRYRFMAGAARKLTVKAFRAAASFDVVSVGMRDYYKQLSGKAGAVCHRYLSAETIRLQNVIGNNDNEIAIGHIGSIYKKDDLLAFISLVKCFFEAKGKKPVLQMWGCHLTINDIPEGLKSYVRFHATLSEEKVIPLLSQCSFVYAMYPMSKALAVFSKTSLPTKLTSYLQAGCPVFGHCPADSTLAEYLNSTGLGTLWTDGDKILGYQALEAISKLKINPAQLEKAREKYFGEANLEVMNKAFGYND